MTSGKRGTLPPVRHPISFASYRAKIFCTGCNTHFKHLEDLAIPLLVPMARGWPIGLGVASQKTLALWGAKTAVALLAAATPEVAKVIPTHHRQAIRELGHPPDEMWVGYVPWEDEPFIWGGDGSLDVSMEDGRGQQDSMHSYTVFFGFGKLGLEVVAFTEPIPSEAILARELPSLRRFWPPKVSIEDWPPDAPSATKEDTWLLGTFAPLLRRD